MKEIELLRTKNPSLTIFDVRDEAFGEYGVVLGGYDTSDIIEEANKLEMPKEGSVYLASVEAFEGLSIAEKIKDEIFGTLDTQVGYCYGHSNYLSLWTRHAYGRRNGQVLLVARPQTCCCVVSPSL